MEITSSQEKFVSLTYEQEAHALLCAAASNTESLLRYFETQAATEKGDAKKLTQKCIEWKRDDLRRIRELIPQALARRDVPTDAYKLSRLIYETAFNYAGEERVFWMNIAIAVRAALSGSAQEPQIPMVTRATGRTIPDLTGIEHVCKWQSLIKGGSANEDGLNEGKLPMPPISPSVKVVEPEPAPAQKEESADAGGRKEG